MTASGAIRAASASLPSVVVTLLSAGSLASYLWFHDPFVRPELERLADIGYVGRILTPLPFAILGSIIALRRPRNRVALVFSCAAILSSLSMSALTYGAFAEGDARSLILGDRFIRLGGGDVALWMSSWAGTIALGLLTVVLFLVFPDGRLPSARWRPVAALAGLAILVVAARGAFGPQSRLALRKFEVSAFDVLGTQVEVLGRRLEVVTVLFIASIAVAAWSVAVRYRTSDQDVRHQLKWFLFAAAIVAAFHLAGPVLHLAGELDETGQIVLAMGLHPIRVLIPLAAGIAIFKYRLYDIDVVLHRTILFGAMSLAITVGYVAATAGIGTALASDATAMVPSALALCPVAVGLAPLRSRTQRFASRVVYGPRAEPYEVLAAFAKTLPQVLPGEDVLPRIAAAAGRGLGAERVAVDLYLPDGAARSTSWPLSQPGGELRPADLTEIIEFRGEEVGRLRVTKPRGRGATHEDRRLLRLLAKSGAAALHNVRLTLELEARRAEAARTATALQESRRRLVTAHLDARRALEEDVRRQVVPRLRPVAELLADARGAEPDAAVSLLEKAVAANAKAVDALRDVAHGMFSPLVDELGLVAAIDSYLRDSPLVATLRVRGADVRACRFDRVVEAAMYSCAVDVLRRTESTVDQVEVSWLDGVLSLRMSGESFDPIAELGRDLVQHVADRVEAVGGSLDVVYKSGLAGAVLCRVPVIEGEQG